MTAFIGASNAFLLGDLRVILFPDLPVKELKLEELSADRAWEPVRTALWKGAFI